MKRKLILILTVILAAFSFEDVEACGEIKELKSSIGTVSSIGDMKYLVTVPEGTTEVTLEGTTDYTWIADYAPRQVSTKNGPIELKIDGTACGYGTYTYFVEFKELSNLIAENDSPSATEPETPSTSDVPEPDGTIDEPNYGVLYLSKLEITGIDFEFEPDKRVYDLEIDGMISKLIIDAATMDSTVTIDISENSQDLKEGLNTITISLSDPYENTGLYILNITKTKPKSSNNFLASLTVEKYQLNFDPSITNYTVEIGKESVLNITAVTESELAHTTILGNSALSDGDNITIRVTAENGSTRDYVITVKRTFNIMDYWIYLLIALLIVLLILILTISKKKKNKKKMGPSTIEGQTETAGAIQEIASQNQVPSPADGSKGETTLTANSPSATPGSLKIIEPTNLDEPISAAPAEMFTEPIATEEDNTEVFQL